MSHSETRTALVTGASSGIGRETARLLAERGYRVLGTCRNPESLPETERVPGVHYLPLDLGDPDSVARCAELAGPVDVLVNNAGQSQVGPLEDVPRQALELQFATNVFGPVQLTQLVLPGMRERGYGRVVMVGSMQASFPVAFRSSYVASKAALKGFGLALRTEVEPFGVTCTVIEPGSVNTGISARRDRTLTAGSPYTERCRRVANAIDSAEARGVPPVRVARTIVKAIEAQDPKPFYAVAREAPLALTLRRLLPRRAMERVTARRHGL
ncbi:putative short-chain dehydrogenase/reductase [Longimycelium tulufanense]|uniref:Putative short-chain dehydrogenase/reductase n=1 Tax=Longimycelium tulufanense TaxID=907463 RepID=A0A8J3CBE4_9PSEU|nr:SDR family oxidoreductase [Longimycelium tulufanense]GGM41417.1 putative short-chain dehydrogenase/reductase [Longimycelium tulufanense]